MSKTLKTLFVTVFTLDKNIHDRTCMQRSEREFVHVKKIKNQRQTPSNVIIIIGDG